MESASVSFTEQIEDFISSNPELAAENFTTQKVKSFFKSKINQIKYSKIYFELKNLNTMEKVTVGLSVAAVGTAISLTIIAVGMKIIIPCIIGIAILASLALLLKLCKFIVKLGKPKGVALIPHESKIRFGQGKEKISQLWCQVKGKACQGKEKAHQLFSKR